MSDGQDEYRLEDIARDHRIAAGLFVPFAVERLQATPIATEAVWTVRLRNIGQPGEQLRRLRVRWSADSRSAQPLGAPAHTVTEWAALGMACVLISCYVGLQVRSVTALGDRFDYWIGTENLELGLEVSGTQTDEVEARHRAKVQQWREN